jgi:hypothetical protein
MLLEIMGLGGHLRTGTLAYTQEYVPESFDVDSYVTCQVEYENAGGTTIAYSTNGAYISANSSTPIPTPTPTIQLPVDRDAPVVNVVTKSCNKRVCKVLVDAQDASGVLSVEAFFNKQTRASSTCKGKGCIKLSSGTLAATAVDSSRWLFTFKVPKKGSLKLQLQVRALDTLGNFSTDAAVASLSYKKADKK